MLIVYVLVLEFWAVTLILKVFKPSVKEKSPNPSILLVAAVALAFIEIFLTEEGTVKS